ncbi:MAG: DUF805 domain-containing protein [Dehalococcoidia bacterium]
MKHLFIPPPSLSFVGAIVACFRKYVVFSGRASRSEFWYFILFDIIFCQLVILYDYIMGTFWSWLIPLVTLLPALAVTTRRLHDTNRTGWWQLLPIASGIPFVLWGWVWRWSLLLLPVSILVIWFWCAQKGDQHANSYD